MTAITDTHPEQRVAIVTPVLEPLAAVRCWQYSSGVIGAGGSKWEGELASVEGPAWQWQMPAAAHPFG